MVNEKVLVDAYQVIDNLTNTYLIKHIPLPDDKLKNLMGVYESLINYPIDEDEEFVLNMVKAIDIMLKADDELKELITEKVTVPPLIVGQARMTSTVGRKFPLSRS